MSKALITTELAYLIKDIRIKNNVKSSDLAKHIGKSPSFITKLEKGEIKSLETEELRCILDFVTHDTNNFDEMINEVFKSLSFRYTPNEIEEQLWFMNFDTVLRDIPIPDKLVDNLNHRISKLNIPIEKLIERINGNEDISPEVENKDDYEFNQWIHFETNGKRQFKFIKIKLDINIVRNILNKEINSINYIALLSICYYLNKMESELISCNFSYDQSQEMRKATNYLNSFKFYSLSEKNKLLENAKTIDEQKSILSDFDNANLEIVNSIISHFRIVSDFKVEYANEKLNTFLKNLDFDASFALAVASLDLHKLNNIDVTSKKDILEKFKDILNSYQENKNEIEIY